MQGSKKSPGEPDEVIHGRTYAPPYLMPWQPRVLKDPDLARFEAAYASIAGSIQSNIDDRKGKTVLDHAEALQHANSICSIIRRRTSRIKAKLLAVKYFSPTRLEMIKSALISEASTFPMGVPSSDGARVLQYSIVTHVAGDHASMGVSNNAPAIGHHIVHMPGHDSEDTFQRPLQCQAGVSTKPGFKEKSHQLFRDEQGRNLMLAAAMDGKNEAIMSLAESLPEFELTDLVNAQDRDGKTPLILAAQGGHDKIVALFCKKGPAGSKLAKIVQPNIEDREGKTALDYAKAWQKAGHSCGRNMMVELTKREDVRYYEAQRYEEMQCSAKRVSSVSKASIALVALASALTNYPAAQISSHKNAEVLVWIVVCLASGLASCLASLMVVIAPMYDKAHQNLRATILYHHHIFLISFSTFLLSLLSFLFGALVAPSLCVPKTPALLGICLLPILTFLTCVGARAHATGKYRKPLRGASGEAQVTVASNCVA